MLNLLQTATIAQRRSGQAATIQYAPPIWASVWAAVVGAPVSFQYSWSGGTDWGQAFPYLAGCEASFSIPTNTPYWSAVFPVGFVGSLEELMLARLPDTPHLVFLSDTQGEVGGSPLGRWTVQADALLFVPLPLNRPAEQQSAVGRSLVGHLREALWTAGATMQGYVELPQFSQRLRDALQLPHELYVFRMRITLPEKIVNNKYYELQV